MREDYNVDGEEIFGDSEDVLNLLQEYNEESSNLLKEDDFDDGKMSFDDGTDEDLLALLDMISKHEESDGNLDFDLDLDDKQADTSTHDSDIHMDYLSDEDILYTNTDDKDVFALDDNNLEFDFNTEDIEHTDEDIMSLDSIWDDNLYDGNTSKDPQKISQSNKEGNRLGDVFSEVLGAVDTLADKELEDLIGEIPKVESQKKNIITRLLLKIKGTKEKTDSKKQTTSAESEEAKQEKKGRSKKKKAQTKRQEEGSLKKEKKISSSKKEKPISKKKAEVKSKKEKQAAKPKKIKVVNKDTGEDNKETEVVVKISGRTYAFVIGFALFLFAFIVLSTNLYTYSLAMQYASTSFDRGQYSEAYYEVYGTNIKKKDKELYEKIVTVMHVNRQLESYSSYYEIQKYPKALDSLIKGIKRYNQYIDYGKELGIEEDMNLVKRTILVELEDKFQISEKRAEELAKIDDMKEYSTMIYSLALEKVEE